jgi:hypothetical protein
MSEVVGHCSPRPKAMPPSSAEVEVLTPKQGVIERPAVIIHKRGFLWPITGAIGVVILGVSAVAIYNLVVESERLHREHIDTPVHADRSQVAMLSPERSRRAVRDDEIEFILRRGDDGPQRVIVARTAADAFVNTQLGYIDQHRQALKAKVSRDLDALFERVFADREAALTAYANWFFGWGTSWTILYQAVTGAINELPKVGLSRTKVTEAARIEVERYLMDHYKEFVLKPEVRDPLIVSGTAQILRDAHQEFLFTLASLDYQLTDFLKKHTRHIEPLRAEDQQRIALDWQAQRWKTPRAQIDGQYQQALSGIAAVAGGAVVLGPILESTVLPLLGEVITETLAGFELTIAGTVAGSEVPLLGNLVGGAIGLAGDYVLAKFRDHMNRDDFVAGNRAAIEATMREWKNKLLPELQKLIDVWMDDTQAAIAQEHKS